MATLHIEHGITDFSTWKANFDRFAVKRSEAGVTASGQSASYGSLGRPFPHLGTDVAHVRSLFFGVSEHYIRCMVLRRLHPSLSANRRQAAAKRSWLGVFQDAAGVNVRLPVSVLDISAVAHQSAMANSHTPPQHPN